MRRFVMLGLFGLVSLLLLGGGAMAVGAQVEASRYEPVELVVVVTETGSRQGARVSVPMARFEDGGRTGWVESNAEVGDQLVVYRVAPDSYRMTPEPSAFERGAPAGILGLGLAMGGFTAWLAWSTRGAARRRK